MGSQDRDLSVNGNTLLMSSAQFAGAEKWDIKNLGLIKNGVGYRKILSYLCIKTPEPDD